jgi:hypothetical protein
MKARVFETIFITEGESASPAAEIQFSGQRLCIVRCRSENPDQFEVEFLSDLYVLQQSVQMAFSLEAFIQVLQQARGDLKGWLIKLAQAGVQA